MSTITTSERSGSRPCHILAMPYPGRGHINPMMNLCKILSSKLDQKNHHRFFITFIVTEEWLGLIGHEPKPDNIRFATIPNVLPSELVRGVNMRSFVEDIHTKMEEPIEELLDHIEIDKSIRRIIIADSLLKWPVDVGNRRNIPVALLWTMSAAAFSIFHHFELLVENGHFPYDLPEISKEIVDYIPGISSICKGDLPTVLNIENLHKILGTFPCVQRAQYLLFSSIFELEPHIINALKPNFPFPLYSLGPIIPFLNLNKSPSKHKKHDYFEWLDSQPPNSVLYVSMGSFLPVSSTQNDEIAAVLRESGVKFLWVARGEASRLKEIAGVLGTIIPWCEQLEVLCHPSVGGFWTHCGWNSTMESVFAGVPMLTCPISIDQLPNSKLIVDDWKVGWRVKRKVESLPTKGEIAALVNRFMSLDSNDRKEMMTRVKELQDISRRALEGGSSEVNLNAFLANI
ncbi:hypothetical protein ACH5RR_032148 [Cinchona calisaya]|uniref:Uncharacterized protein n=1 Tax=Cinchona calisaya TaxID=153742 RepID=A0ABD2YHA1_9GENT